MKFFAPIYVAAALCGLAASTPTLAVTAPLEKRFDYWALDDAREFDPNRTFCEITGKYVVCVNGAATFFTCDGGCQLTWPNTVHAPAVSRCNNGKLTTPPDYHDWFPDD